VINFNLDIADDIAPIKGLKERRASERGRFYHCQNKYLVDNIYTNILLCISETSQLIKNDRSQVHCYQYFIYTQMRPMALIFK
jgi:hypothetical protein